MSSVAESMLPKRKVPEDAPEEVKPWKRGSIEGEIRAKRFSDRRIGWIRIVVKNDPEIADLCEELGISWTSNLEAGYTLADIAAMRPHDSHSIARFVLKMLETMEHPSSLPKLPMSVPFSLLK